MIICKSITISGFSGKQYPFSIYPNHIDEISLQAIGIFLKLENNVYKTLSAADLTDYDTNSPENQYATHLAIHMEDKCQMRSEILVDINTTMKEAS